MCVCVRDYGWGGQYVNAFVCVCVCVCDRERVRERKGESYRDRIC